MLQEQRRREATPAASKIKRPPGRPEAEGSRGPRARLPTEPVLKLKERATSFRRRAFRRQRPGLHCSLRAPGRQSVPQVQEVGALWPCFMYRQQNLLPPGTRAGAAETEEPKSQSYTEDFGPAQAGLEFTDANARAAHLNG